MTSHVFFIGETQYGKTRRANALHQGGETVVSVFFNTNRVSNIWGTVVHSVADIRAGLRRGALKFNFLPHRGPNAEDLEKTRAQLRSVIQFFEAYWSDRATRWGRLLLDEAQLLEDELRYCVTTLLGKRVQVVGITQYPVMVDTTSRSNMPVWCIFKAGFQMAKFFAGFGGDAFPAAAIQEWTSRGPGYMARYTPQAGWQFFAPLPDGSS